MMKRLLSQIGLTYFAVLAVVFCFDTVVSLILLGVFVICAVLFFSIRKIRKTKYLPAMALAAAVACCVFWGYTTLYVQPLINAYQGKGQAITATLADESYVLGENYIYPLNVTGADNKSAHFKAQLSLDSPINAKTGDTLRFRGELKAAGSRYLRGKNCFFYAYADDTITVSPAASPTPYALAVSLRSLLRERLRSVVKDGDVGFYQAVLLGDRHAMYPSMKEDFRDAGVSYYVVVSGMHFAIFISFILFILRRLKLRRAVQTCIAMGAAVLFMAMTGFSPSVMRSGWMVLVYLLAQMMRRISYPPNALGLSCIAMTVFMSPYCAGDTGLVLSVAATFAILLWADAIYKRIPLQFRIEKEREKSKGKRAIYFLIRIIQEIRQGILALFATSLAANILVLPLSLLLFGAVSPITLLSAILLYLPVYLTMLFGFLIFLIGIIPFLWPLSLVFASAMEMCGGFTLFLVKKLSEFPYAYVYADSSVVYIWLFVTVALVLAAVLSRKHGRRLYIRHAAAVSLVLLIVASLSAFVFKSMQLKLSIPQTDKGMCVTLSDGLDTDALMLDAPWSTVEEIGRLPGLRTAVLGTARERKNISDLKAGGIDISTVFVYDVYERYKWEHIACFSEDTVFRLSRYCILRLYPVEKKLVRYLYAGDKTVLLLPEGVDASTLPAELCRADIIVLSDIPLGVERLTCETLILRAGNQKVLRRISHSMLYTDNDLSLSLR